MLALTSCICKNCVAVVFMKSLWSWTAFCGMTQLLVDQVMTFCRALPQGVEEAPSKSRLCCWRSWMIFRATVIPDPIHKSKKLLHVDNLDCDPFIRALALPLPRIQTLTFSFVSRLRLSIALTVSMGKGDFSHAQFQVFAEFLNLLEIYNLRCDKILGFMTTSPY